MKNKKFILMTILFIVVGFAAVSTSLILNGTIRIKANEEDFNVYFSEALLNGEDMSNVFITDDTHISFKTKDLKNVGDKAVLDFSVTNGSSMYDADVQISCTKDASDYTSHTITPTSMRIAAKEKDTGKLSIVLEKAVTEEKEETIECTLTANALEKGSVNGAVIPEDNTYSLRGTLVNSKNEVLSNQKLVIYSETPHFVTTNTSGNIFVANLEKGYHEIFLLGTTTQDLATLTKNEIANMAIAKASFSTNNATTINFDNGTVITNVTISDKAIYTDPTLNGTDPVLKENLIPITLANDGTVTYASEEAEWYNYSDKKWANSVILIDNPSTVYNVGDIINESDIESYFVWVPRYKYKIFNEGNYTTYTGTTNTNGSAQTIEIVFESKDVPVSTGSKVGDYLTHPAFTNFDVNGIWVGKYETGYAGATTTAAAQVDSAESNKIIVKPNVYSWRNVTVSNIFKAAYNYSREMDSHMMKNTEWGAVAYLSHSQYGINKEININNNSAYLTGYSAVEGTNQSTYPGTYGTEASKTLAYNTSTGYKASTTGNITGVYDMSGGAHEYMAAYRANTLGASGFSAAELNTYAKYLDVYNANASITSYNNRILGDATGEMGPFNNFKDGDNVSRYHNSWYSDVSYFVDSTYPWFRRGGVYDNGVLAGQFDFDRNTGGVNSAIGSRVVLVI